jgi:hypothetical protein
MQQHHRLQQRQQQRHHRSTHHHAAGRRNRLIVVGPPALHSWIQNYQFVHVPRGAECECSATHCRTRRRGILHSGLLLLSFFIVVVLFCEMNLLSFANSSVRKKAPLVLVLPIVCLRPLFLFLG